MKITEKDVDGIKVLFINGEIDAATCQELEKHLDQLVSSGLQGLILDLGNVSYISSAGLRVILKVAKDFYGHGKVAISQPRENVRSILEMVGLTTLISIHDSMDEAIREVQQA